MLYRILLELETIVFMGIYNRLSPTLRMLVGIYNSVRAKILLAKNIIDEASALNPQKNPTP